MKYVLDTDTSIFYMKGKYNLEQKIREVKFENVFVSEITIAELKFGLINAPEGKKKEKNKLVTKTFIETVAIIPIFDTLDFYAEEKARLRKLGTPIDEFDLLIGSSAVVNGYIMVTNNEKHFNRIKGIKIENWTK
ncbi:MAG: PIN domain-containing protein [Bacteroidota bacterium]